MSKKALTNEQKQFIQDNQTTSAADLSKDMYGVGPKTVQKHLDTLQATEKAKPPVTKSIQPIMVEGAKTQKGGVVMTGAISKAIEPVARGGAANMTNAIAKIYPDEPLPKGVKIDD